MRFSKINRMHFHSILLFTVYIMASLAYRMIYIGEISYNGDFRTAYSGLLLTDSIEYYNYNNASDGDNLGVQYFRSVKNYLGPIILIRIMGGIAFGDLIINSILMLLSLLLLMKVLEHFHIYKVWYVLPLICNPIAIVYSQGFNKEIPLVLCVMLFVYSVLKNRKLLSLLAVVVAYVFRTQVALLFIFYLIFQLLFLKLKKSIPYILMLSIPIMFVFPILYRRLAVAFLESSDFYYSNSMGYGIGNIATQIMLNVPFGAYLGIAIHAMQNMLEPVLTINLDSAYGVLMLFSSVLVTPLFLILCGQVVFNVLSGRLYENKYYSLGLHQFVVLSILFVSINPIIQARYLFCFLPILPLAIKRTSSLLPFFRRSVYRFLPPSPEHHPDQSNC